jgi:signal transduction histidine kinase
MALLTRGPARPRLVRVRPGRDVQPGFRAGASLARLRGRLTLWYVGVFTVIMGLFGLAIYREVNRQMLAGLDRSLERAVEQRTRWVLAPSQRGPTLGAQDSTLWERKVVVFNADGEPVSPPEAEPWVREVAAQALEHGTAKVSMVAPDGRTWVLYGKRFRTSADRTYATVAAADVVEIQDRYPSVFPGYLAFALLAVLLATIGGAGLARKSAAPVEAAFEQMRRFMGDAAHELKTPVAVLRARVDVALQRPRSEDEYQEVLAGVSGEAARLGSLVDDMLLLARADAGEWPTRRERVLLDDLLLEAAAAAGALGAAKDVTVQLGDLEETLVAGDASLLHRLFMILLDNAVHFTPPGGTVTIGSRRQAGRCHVTIADSGPGIPAATLPYVFDRFYRADGARGRSGAGLGLAIARWIMDVHRGRIEITSMEGSGTTVRLSFPGA